MHSCFLTDRKKYLTCFHGHTGIRSNFILFLMSVLSSYMSSSSDFQTTELINAVLFSFQLPYPLVCFLWQQDAHRCSAPKMSQKTGGKKSFFPLILYRNHTPCSKWAETCKNVLYKFVFVLWTGYTNYIDTNAATKCYFLTLKQLKTKLR